MFTKDRQSKLRAYGILQSQKTLANFFERKTLLYEREDFLLHINYD
jgi:hypothetical protein